MRPSKGFTLIELLLVVCILALLATLSFPLFGMLRQKAGLVGCIGNMRLIGVGLNVYLQDHNMIWPQEPESGFQEETEMWKWWEQTMSDYGVARKHLICPSDGGNNSDTNLKGDTFFGTYVPAKFDEYPNTAFRWNQPWLLERAGYHGVRGPNMLMPDGSVKEGISL
jgi:prepilin-type N-terminal cleavage/methylation domain-containing protein